MWATRWSCLLYTSVSLFNPSMQQAQITMDDSLSVYRNGMTEYKDRAAELRREADQAEEDGDMAAYATYEMNAQMMNELANQYKDVVEQSERMSTQRSIVSVSYPHLDVYKRQRVKRLEEFRVLIEMCMMSILIAFAQRYKNGEAIETVEWSFSRKMDILKNGALVHKES